MTAAGVAVGAAILVAIFAVIAAGYVIAHRRSAEVVPGAPDRATDEVVNGLLTELRKAQAEAAHWKVTAERLQRQVDGRG
jgi:hypothetical protein